MEAAMDLTSAVYGIRAEMLDEERVRRQQDAMLGDGKAVAGTAPSGAPENLKTATRRHKSEIEKELTALNKGGST